MNVEPQTAAVLADTEAQAAAAWLEQDFALAQAARVKVAQGCSLTSKEQEALARHETPPAPVAVTGRQFRYEWRAEGPDDWRSHP